jgi:hypothetical protein
MTVLVASNIIGITPNLFESVFSDRMNENERHATIKALMEVDFMGPEEFKTLIESKLYPSERICLDYLNGKYKKVIITDLNDGTEEIFDSIIFSGIT